MYVVSPETCSISTVICEDVNKRHFDIGRRTHSQGRVHFALPQQIPPLHLPLADILGEVEIHGAETRALGLARVLRRLAVLPHVIGLHALHDDEFGLARAEHAALAVDVDAHEGVERVAPRH